MSPTRPYLRCFALAVLFVSCYGPPPELGDEFADHTVLALEELGPDVRLSFRGADPAASQTIDEEARADESLFVLLAPRAVRQSRTVEVLDGADATVMASCSRTCAQKLKYKNDTLSLPGVICRKGPVALRSGIDFGPAPEGRVYESRELSFPGRFELPDQVVCYETFVLYEGSTECVESCMGCGPGEFACIFTSPSLGLVPTEQPAGNPSSVSSVDCDPCDQTGCGSEKAEPCDELPGGGNPID